MTSYKLFHIEDWLLVLQGKGQLTFSLEELCLEAKPISLEAIKLSLNRLVNKNKIVSVHQGYYVIVPPSYQNLGILPPIYFIDGLMNYLKRQYYVGLTNAATMHGAAHQQPQSFYVVSALPTLRPTIKKNLLIHYLNIKNFPNQSLIEQRKTETGYVNISSAELTATDLIQYEKRIGGLNRAATILNELADEMQIQKLNQAFLATIPVVTIQRLGYLMEVILERNDIAQKLYTESKAMGHTFFRIPLKASKTMKNYTLNEKWKVVVNTEIEIDE
jgi:predicted transcriptional regulator of viral defense system